MNSLTNGKTSYIDWKYGKHDPLTTLIQLFPKKDWNWEKLSENKNIKLSYILNNILFPWNWSSVQELYEKEKIENIKKGHGYHYYIPKKMFKFTLYDGDFSDHFILKNLDITMRDILSNAKKYSSDRDGISAHPNIQIRDILKYSNLKWRWDYVSRNPNLTLKTVLKYPKKNWDFSKISKNQFLQNDKAFKNSIKSDIKKRREKVRKINLFGSLESLVEKYVGYA